MLIFFFKDNPLIQYKIKQDKTEKERQDYFPYLEIYHCYKNIKPYLINVFNTNMTVFLKMEKISNKTLKRYGKCSQHISLLRCKIVCVIIILLKKDTKD